MYQGAFHVKCTPKVRQGICVVRRTNGQLVELVILYARKGGGCKGTGPPEISTTVVSKSCRKILFYACAAHSFARQLLKRLRTPEVFSFVCTPHAEKKPKSTPKIFGPKCMECRLANVGTANALYQIHTSLVRSNGSLSQCIHK